MAILRSTDFNVISKRQGKFASIIKINSHNTLALRISSKLAYDMNLGNKCILEYDTDVNEISIIKDDNGNIGVARDGITGDGKIYNRIYLGEINKYFNIDLKTGRYVADIVDGKVVVYLNKFLGDDYGRKAQ